MKSAIQQAFIDNGGSLSHHHGVGLEHAPWLEQDISAQGVAVMRGLFEAADPGENFNPRQDRRRREGDRQRRAERGRSR